MKAVVRALVVTVLVTVTTSVGATVPAQAATSGSACPAGRGITVVVDYQGLSSQPIAQICDGSGTTNALALFNAHFGLTYFHGGGVCTIDTLPHNYSCAVPMHSPYWSLWWATSSGGSWVYSQTGADGLQVPPNGFVAFSWDASTDANVKAAPRVLPRHSPSPIVKSTPSVPISVSPTARTSSRPTVTTPTPSTTSSAASTAPSRSASATPSARPSVSPTVAATGAADPTALPSGAKKSDGLAWWVAPGIIALLGAAGGGLWLVRRRP